MSDWRPDPYVVDTLMRDLVGHDKRPAAFILYLHLHRRAGGAGTARCVARASLQSLTRATGLSRSAVQTSLEWLRQRGLVSTARSSATAVPSHTVLAPWQRR